MFNNIDLRELAGISGPERAFLSLYLATPESFAALKPRIETLRALLEMMEEKERLVRLLNGYIDGPGMTVVIGAEHTSPGLRPFSLVASTVVDGGATRTVGVIGPMRMHYSRTITLVDSATQAVSKVLREPD